MNPFTDIKLNHDSPVYQQLCLHIKRKILKGELVNDQELPSRREVAASLSINPNTVQKAYKTMEEEGCLKTIANVKSVIIMDEKQKEKIQSELIDQMISEFIEQCKEAGINQQRVIDLLIQQWK